MLPIFNANIQALQYLDYLILLKQISSTVNFILQSVDFQEESRYKVVFEIGKQSFSINSKAICQHISEKSISFSLFFPVLDIKHRTLSRQISFFSVYLRLIVKCLCMSVCAHMCEREKQRERERKLVELVPSFHHVRARDHIQVLDLAAITFPYLAISLPPSSVLLPFKVLFGSFQQHITLIRLIRQSNALCISPYSKLSLYHSSGYKFLMVIN